MTISLLHIGKRLPAFAIAATALLATPCLNHAQAEGEAATTATPANTANAALLETAKKNLPKLQAELLATLEQSRKNDPQQYKTIVEAAGTRALSSLKHSLKPVDMSNVRGAPYATYNKDIWRFRSVAGDVHALALAYNSPESPLAGKPEIAAKAAEAFAWALTVVTPKGTCDAPDSNIDRFAFVQNWDAFVLMSPTLPEDLKERFLNYLLTAADFQLSTYATRAYPMCGGYPNMDAAFTLVMEQAYRLFEKPEYNAQVAEDAAVGKVQGGLVPLVHAFPDGKIDWFYNATEHEPGQALNTEWQWQLNRMAFWNDMANAYMATRDERYPKAFGSQLRSWIDQCPMPKDAQFQNTHGHTAWRTIETGIRMSYSWPNAFFRLLPGLTDTDIMAFTRSIYEQGNYLRLNASGVNWLLMEMNGLSTLGCYFPEFRAAGDWRAYAFSRFTAEAREQLLPDGAQYELSTGYHTDVVITNFVCGLNNAVNTGREAEVPQEYVKSLEKAFEWTMYLATPGKGRPTKNDSWPGPIKGAMSTAAKLYPDRQDFKWFATDGHEGQPPQKTSVFLDWSGQIVERSGWETDANYLIFNVGPLGYGGLMGIGHAHQDKLNVCVWAYGREILFDGGGSSYAQDKWRVWSRGSLSHNCVAVNGLGQNRLNSTPDANPRTDPNRVSQEPIKASWHTDAAYDFATGVYDDDYGTSEYNERFAEAFAGLPGPHKRRFDTERRSVLFLKPDIYIVGDWMKPLDALPHTYQARWHLLPTQVENDPATHAVATADPGVPNLAVIPLLTQGLAVKTASAQEKPELLGWHCRKDMKPQNIPATTVLHTVSGTGAKQFLTLLLPLPPNQKNPVQEVKQLPDHVVIQFADGRHLMVFTNDAGCIAAKEYSKAGTCVRTAVGEVNSK